MPPKPQALKPNRDGFPTELKAIPHWFAWRYEWKQGRWAKTPVDPRAGRNGDVSDLTTAGTFDEAWACYERLGLDGVGFVFTESDPYVGVDLDKCRDPEMGVLEAWAAGIFRDLASATDVSPSETGIKIIVRARKTGDRCRKGGIEIYSRGRFFTLTGHRQTGAPTSIESRQPQLDSLYSDTFGTTNQPEAITGIADSHEAMSDDTVLNLLRRSKRRDRVQAILDRTIPEFNQNDRGCDDSQYDLALCWELAFYTRNRTQIGRIVGRLMPREKWNRADYRERTIQQALKTQHGRYTGVVPVAETPEDCNDEITLLRAENAQLRALDAKKDALIADQQAIITSQATELNVVNARMGDINTFAHDSRLKDHDVRGMIALCNLMQSYPSDDVRDMKRIYMADIGAVFGAGVDVKDRDGTLRGKGSKLTKALTEAGIIEITKFKNERGHNECYITMIGHPDKSLTRDDLRGTYRKEQAARSAEYRCSCCGSKNLRPKELVCLECGISNSDKEAAQAAVEFDLGQFTPVSNLDTIPTSINTVVGTGGLVSQSVTGQEEETPTTHHVSISAPTTGDPVEEDQAVSDHGIEDLVAQQAQECQDAVEAAEAILHESPVDEDWTEELLNLITLALLKGAEVWSTSGAFQVDTSCIPLPLERQVLEHWDVFKRLLERDCGQYSRMRVSRDRQLYGVGGSDGSPSGPALHVKQSAYRSQFRFEGVLV